PDEDEMGRRHELGDEGAACGRARERSGGDAEPAGVVGRIVVAPEILSLLELEVLQEQLAEAGLIRRHIETLEEPKAPGQAIGGLRLVRRPAPAKCGAAAPYPLG